MLDISPITRRKRQRKLLDQRRRRDDLLAFRQCRLLIDVNDFEVVPPFEMFLTDRPDIFDRAGRTRRHAGHVEAEHVSLSRRLVTPRRPVRR